MPSSKYGQIAFIQSSWHAQIVDSCRTSFAAAMFEAGFADNQIEYFSVPGAFELPLQSKLLAQSRRYVAIVAAGLIVDGGIYRHEFVAATVLDALMRIQIEVEVPILSAVLTPQSFHAHQEHQHFFRDHFVVKGREAAAACALTIANMASLAKMHHLSR
jgi:6,7-dimethyl-8-ribityllumazine synthase